MEEILRASAEIFAEEGYENATTNAIAARAGVSPGSLYQFFKNKDDIAHALAEAYVTQLRSAKDDAFPGADDLSVGAAIDRVIEPLVAFNVANPGFKALFARSDMPASLQAAVAPIHESMHRQVAAAIGALIPSLSDAELDRTVTVAIHLVRGMMPPIVAAEGPARDALVGELKTVLVSYLTERGAG
jgi:AcrR family transcriptional regulator